MALVDEHFLSRVGHDLRGELATMVAGVHYLLRYEQGLGDSAKQMLERVDGAGQRMKRLLDEFDNAAWITGGDPAQLVPGPCLACEVVAGALERLAPQIGARNVRVEVEVPAALGPFEADAELFGVAVEYVIDFALARSPGGRVRIAAVEASRLELRIEDSGGAVDDDHLTRVFEPFVEKDVVPRVTTGGAKRRERLGLGLAIARGIAGAHRAELRVERGADGLVFVFVAPDQAG